MLALHPLPCTSVSNKQKEFDYGAAAGMGRCGCGTWSPANRSRSCTSRSLSWRWRWRRAENCWSDSAGKSLVCPIADRAVHAGAAAAVWHRTACVTGGSEMAGPAAWDPHPPKWANVRTYPRPPRPLTSHQLVRQYRRRATPSRRAEPPAGTPRSMEPLSGMAATSAKQPPSRNGTGELVHVEEALLAARRACHSLWLPGR